MNPVNSYHNQFKSVSEDLIENYSILNAFENEWSKLKSELNDKVFMSKDNFKMRFFYPGTQWESFSKSNPIADALEWARQNGKLKEFRGALEKINHKVGLQLIDNYDFHPLFKNSLANPTNIFSPIKPIESVSTPDEKLLKEVKELQNKNQQLATKLSIQMVEFNELKFNYENLEKKFSDQAKEFIDLQQSHRATLEELQKLKQTKVEQKEEKSILPKVEVDPALQVNFYKLWDKNQEIATTFLLKINEDLLNLNEESKKYSIAKSILFLLKQEMHDKGVMKLYEFTRFNEAIEIIQTINYLGSSTGNVYGFCQALIEVKNNYQAIDKNIASKLNILISQLQNHSIFGPAFKYPNKI